ncbi:MAG: serine/threonine protein kinase [Planctomycetes bacterium]|nr:serine/threonine protein kinase [Planctomycetota bacterium]
MAKEHDVRLLATLAHRGLVSADDARAALQADDPGAVLVARGVCDAATWREWQETAGGVRPKLSRYELVEMIGQGGQAVVWRARDRAAAGEIVALKVLRPELAQNEAAVRGFVQEARTLIELDSPHIVKGKRVAREGATIFFAMQLIEGECLQQTLDRDGRLDEDRALGIVRQVARALEDLRRAGLVHRDVKPGNVMIDARDHAWLIDLGFATGSGSPGGGETTAGTVHYIAPEQARGAGDLDVRADIYALGATLYHLVTGSLPFDGASSQEVLAKQVLESLSGARIRDMDLSPHTHWFIEKMMAKEKEIRFQDPAQLGAEIDRVLEQRAREHEAHDPLERLRARRRRRR